MMSNNRLAREHSAYLRHAADQPIDWFAWGDEAFAVADRENKPVFMSSGAVWCHWCHVMAKESFYRPDVASFLNEHFICIKLDRDERPDVDRRYQQAVAAMGGSGGWPLTVFLTSDRKPFFGGTYFPPEERGGRPGFLAVLEAIWRLYGESRNAADDFSRQLLDAMKPESSSTSQLSSALLADAEVAMMQQADPYNGGFGSAPKFPLTGAISFLTGRYAHSGNPEIGPVVVNTLTKMALGGIYDHLQGGFHRYSTDAGWNVPHFEKMADDNAWLLRNYAEAWAVFGDPLFRTAAEGIIRFLQEVLAHPDGGYSASQDADVTPDDEGGYFTWTARQMREVLDDREYELLTRHYLHPRGAMHHDPEKFVLSVARPVSSVAQEIGLDPQSAEELLADGRMKLLAARRRREAPLVDTARYTSLNGMIIASLALAGRIFGDRKLAASAAYAFDRILALRKRGDALFHSDAVPAMLEDYIFLSEAALVVHEATGSASYLQSARELMKICRSRLWDSDGGGFSDTEDALLGIRIKPSDDMPHPAANSVAASVLLKLHRITDDEVCRSDAETILKMFAERASALGLHAGAFFCSLDLWHSGMTLKLGGAMTDELAAAVPRWLPNLTLRYDGPKGTAVPCSTTECFEPLTNAEAAHTFVRDRFPGMAGTLQGSSD